MKTVTKSAICALVGVFVVYALFSFAAWQFNPGDWSDGMRAFCAMFMAAIGWLGAMLGEILP